MFKTVKKEKKKLNPIRRTVNFIVIPIYVVACIALLAPMICLMEIDEDKYLPAFLALFGVFVLLTAALLISIPFIRKKEVGVELSKYDLDVAGAELRDEYVFEQTQLAATFPLTSSPFEEFENDSAAFSGIDGLKKLLDYYGLEPEQARLSKSPLDYGRAIVSDYTENARYTKFIADADGKDTLKVYANYKTVIDGQGLKINGVNLDFSRLNAEIVTFNYLMQVHIYLAFFAEEEDLTVFIKLSKDVLAFIDKFSINIENRKILDFILNNRAAAFEEILKRGRITEKKLKYQR